MDKLVPWVNFDRKYNASRVQISHEKVHVINNFINMIFKELTNVKYSGDYVEQLYCVCSYILSFKIDGKAHTQRESLSVPFWFAIVFYEREFTKICAFCWFCKWNKKSRMIESWKDLRLNIEKVFTVNGSKREWRGDVSLRAVSRKA